MGMFGIEQLNNLLSEDHSKNREERLTQAFNEVTKAAETVLSDRTRTMFDSGDRLQREMVDLTFDMFRSENWSPKKMLDRAADLAESSADAMRDTGKQSSTKSKSSAASGRRSSKSS